MARGAPDPPHPTPESPAESPVSRQHGSVGGARCSRSVPSGQGQALEREDAPHAEQALSELGAHCIQLSGRPALLALSPARALGVSLRWAGMEEEESDRAPVPASDWPGLDRTQEVLPTRLPSRTCKLATAPSGASKALSLGGRWSTRLHGRPQEGHDDSRGALLVPSHRPVGSTERSLRPGPPFPCAAPQQASLWAKLTTRGMPESGRRW